MDLQYETFINFFGLELLNRKRMAHIAAGIRHNATNYDKFMPMYRAQPHLREKLKHVCMQRARNLISTEYFESMVSEIESNVDLNKGINKRRYIEMRMAELSDTYPQVSRCRLKKFIEDELSEILQHTARQKIIQNNSSVIFEDDFDDYDVYHTQIKKSRSYCENDMSRVLYC